MINMLLITRTTLKKFINFNRQSTISCIKGLWKLYCSAHLHPYIIYPYKILDFLVFYWILNQYFILKAAKVSLLVGSIFPLVQKNHNFYYLLILNNDIIEKVCKGVTAFWLCMLLGPTQLLLFLLLTYCPQPINAFSSDYEHYPYGITSGLKKSAVNFKNNYN